MAYVSEVVTLFANAIFCLRRSTKAKGNHESLNERQITRKKVFIYSQKRMQASILYFFAILRIVNFCYSPTILFWSLGYPD